MAEVEEKELWNSLAKSNSKYYIFSDKGKGVTEKQFRDSGYRDYCSLIQNDNMLEKQGTILEIGCGLGRILEFMSEDFTEVIGVDISGEMVKQALARLPVIENDDHLLPTVIENDGYLLPVADNSCDVVFSYLVFQHMKSMDIVESNFREALRVLKPGGIFKVRVRTDEVKRGSWWAGVTCNEDYPLSIGFNLLKKEPVEDYGLWLWLKKGD